MFGYIIGSIVAGYVCFELLISSIDKEQDTDDITDIYEAFNDEAYNY